MKTHDSTYAKPYLTVREQVALLVERGMTVGDAREAESLLRRVGYYRLSGYWYPYRERHLGADGVLEVSSSLRPGTTLQHVSEIYDFDRQLRMMLLDALEMIEVALRFQVGHALGRRSAFAHRDPACLDPAFSEIPDADGEANSRHDEWLGRFDEQERRSQEAFAVHFREKYGPHFPVWVATEVMSFGTLGQLYSGAAQDDRERIAVSLDLITSEGKGDSTLLANWFNHIRHIRNLCAHHSRMWNRALDVELVAADHVPELAHLTPKSRRRIYGTIAVLTYLLTRVMPESDWRQRVRKLIEEQTTDLHLNLDALGFPEGWDDAALWQRDYARDQVLARRAELISGLDTSSTAATRDLLHSRDPKDRRSWLNYLRTRHALISVSFGEARLIPVFQIDTELGDIISIVGNINSELHALATSAGIADLDANWQILEWWITEIPTIGRTPQEQLQAGELRIENARTLYPLFGL